MPSTILYLSIFFVTGILSEYSVRLKDYLIEEKVKKILFILFALFIPSLFAGIRYGIGTDYNNYTDIFTAINTGVGNNPTEIGYTILNFIVGQFGGSIQTVFFIMSFLTMLFVYLFLIEYKENISVGIGMLIFLIMFYNMSYNIVRQVLAMTITLYATKYLDKKKPKSFVLFILLAMSFHAGAVILLPLYWVYNSFPNKRKFYRVMIYIVYFLALANYQNIVEFVSLNILGTEKYLYLAKDAGGNLALGSVVQFAPHLLIGFVFYDGLMEENKSFKFFYFLLVIGYLTGLLPAFGAPIVLRRIGGFFTITNVWLVPYYYRYFKHKENYFWLVPLLIIYMLLLWYVMYIMGGDAETVPYNTIFNL